jgi:pimeloyl-ACP methyl ester carboxylesterase
MILPAAETHTLVLEDRRTIAWCEYGDLSSPHPPIFYFHSFPSSRIEGASFQKVALALNLRIISPDRPGMGLSSLQPSRTFSSYPSDILALASHLNIPKFQLLSVSGGGPYLLACLKNMSKDRCLGAQLVSGIYPRKLGIQGMRFAQRAIMFLAYYTPSFVGTLMDWQFGAAARDPDPQKLTDLVMQQAKGLPERDRQAFESDELGPFIIAGLREAFSDGGVGVGVDAGLYATHWGFELEDVDASRLRIWHGKDDENCPFAMAEKAAVCLKDAETRFLEGEAHSVIAYHKEEILKNFIPAQ